MKYALIGIFIGVAFIGFMIFLGSNNQTNEVISKNNVSLVDNKQIIEIKAKGGYSPSKMLAKANIPTIIKVKTEGTFDCSSALVIPSLQYQKNLPFSGETLIEVPPQSENTTLEGMCSMGMYNFSITFNS